MSTALRAVAAHPSCAHLMALSEHTSACWETKSVRQGASYAARVAHYRLCDATATPSSHAMSQVDVSVRARIAYGTANERQCVVNGIGHALLTGIAIPLAAAVLKRHYAEHPKEWEQVFARRPRLPIGVPGVQGHVRDVRKPQRMEDRRLWLPAGDVLARVSP